MPATERGKSSRSSSTIGVQSRVAHRSFTRATTCSISFAYARYSASPWRDGYTIATNTTRPRSPGRASSSRSYARKPRTMFFDGSMRSLRAITSRSPTASSSAPRPRRAARPTPRPLRARRRRGRGSRRTAARSVAPRRAPRGPTAGTRRPSAWCGNRPGPTRARGTALRRRRSGSTRMSSGPQNGVWVKCTTRRSGRSARSCPAHERELVVVHEHDIVRRPRLARSRRRTRRSPRRTRPTRRGSAGRSAAGATRSNRPWNRNHNTPFDTTS